jgi:hypothetical protein
MWQLAALAAAAVAVGAVWIVAVTTSGGGDPHPTGGSPDVYPEQSIPAPADRSLTHAAAAAGCTVRSFPSFARERASGHASYRTNPPTSGPESRVPAADGIYDEPPSTARLVHSLARGRVILQFAPGTPAAVRGRLKALFHEDPRHLILTPNATNMPFEVAASAWRRYIGCDRASDAMLDALRDFRIAFRDRAPERSR